MQNSSAHVCTFEYSVLFRALSILIYRAGAAADFIRQHEPLRTTLRPLDATSEHVHGGGDQMSAQREGGHSQKGLTALSFFLLKKTRYSGGNAAVRASSGNFNPFAITMLYRHPQPCPFTPRLFFAGTWFNAFTCPVRVLTGFSNLSCEERDSSHMFF